jgi:FMN phosphatase YigB (HAD superfamily)
MIMKIATPDKAQNHNLGIYYLETHCILDKYIMNPDRSPILACDRIILWDIDGVLITHHPGNPAMDWRRALLDRGWLEIWEEFQKSACWNACLTDRGRDVHIEFAAFIRSAGIAGIDTAAIIGHWLEGNGQPSMPALQRLKDLCRAGYSCALASNQDGLRAGRLAAWLAAQEIGSLPCFFSCDIGAAKPDPAFFRNVESRLGVAGDTLVLLDDRPENVVAACAAGWTARHIAPDFAWHEFSGDFSHD